MDGSVQAAPVSPAASAGRRVPRAPRLDARLRAAADWVAPCGVCADIGCDHGRFGAVLLRENRCRRLLAADVSAMALEKARARLAALGLLDRAVFAVADGLDALSALPDGRADTVCILGMGGDTVAGILRRGQTRLQGAALILGAQTELSPTRMAIQQIGYRITDERVADAGGRLYLLMRAEPAPAGAPPYTDKELLLGPRLLARLPPEWRPWLMRRNRLLGEAAAAMRAAAGRDAARLAETERELRYTQEALQALDGRAAKEREAGR